MQTIWKFPLDVTGYQRVNMPAKAKILCVQTQGGYPCLWAQVESTSEVEPRAFVIAGTGHPQDTGGKYIGTFQLHGGELVFHAFEVEVR